MPESAAPVAAMIVLFWVIAVTITLYNKWTFSSQRTPHTPIAQLRLPGPNSVATDPGCG